MGHSCKKIKNSGRKFCDFLSEKEVRGICPLQADNTILTLWTREASSFSAAQNGTVSNAFFEEDGFTLGYKRLSQGYFKWPRNAEEARNLTWEEYDRLMDGFEIESSIKGI